MITIHFLSHFICISIIHLSFDSVFLWILRKMLSKARMTIMGSKSCETDARTVSHFYESQLELFFSTWRQNQSINALFGLNYKHYGSILSFLEFSYSRVLQLLKASIGHDINLLFKVNILM